MSREGQAGAANVAEKNGATGNEWWAEVKEYQLDVHQPACSFRNSDDSLSDIVAKKGAP